MPSHSDLPDIERHRKAFSDGVIGQKDEFADTRTGSVYDDIGSVSAILWSRESQRDRDMFHDCYFDGATGPTLTNTALKRFGINRVLDTYGTGNLIITRPTTAGGAGTIFTGTRVVVYTPGSVQDPKVYAVASDTPILSTQLQAAIPIRFTRFGVGAQINARVPQYYINVPDILYDTTFTAQSISCSDGTTYENDEDFRSRIRTQRTSNRVGYIQQIVTTLSNAGIKNAAIFRSDFTNTDFGINAIYVGDASFVGSPQLVTTAILALESVRVLGAYIYVGQMTNSVLSVTANVFLNDSPGNFNLNLITNIITSAMIAYIQKNNFGFTLSGLAGSVKDFNKFIQSIQFITPSSDITVTSLVGGFLNFPQTLTRYALSANNISLTFFGPQ